MSEMKVYIGVDIGGSHVCVGFLDANGTILAQIDTDIDNFSIQPVEMITTIVNLIAKKKLKEWSIVSIGIGCPGQAKENILVVASNLPNFKNVPLPKMLSEKMNNIPVLLVNDADAAICAEVWGKDSKQYYKKAKNIVMLTLGTGIGCGLILEGQLYQGSNGLIEGGHSIVSTQAINNRKCGCGQSGCAEVFASAKNTAIRLQELDDADNAKKKAGTTTTPPVTGSKEVFDRYAMNDFNAVKIVEETAEHLAILCINISRILDPDIIIFSGGMSKAGETLLELIRKNIKRYSWTVLPNYAELCVARSIDSGGMVGAALAGKKYFESGGGLTTGMPSSVSPKDSNSGQSTALIASGASVLFSMLGLYWLSSSNSSSGTSGNGGSSIVMVRYLQWFQLISSVGLGIYAVLSGRKPDTVNSVN